MYTKLTLKMDESVILYAKDYAAEYDQSLSKMVEDFFRKIVSENASHKNYSPLVQDLSGVISEADLDKKDYVTYLENKYQQANK
jgi:hypothetical protein